jgi:hypothetical protein
MYLIDRKKGKPATIRLFGDQPSVQTEIFGITGSPHWRYIEVEVNPAGFFNRRRGVGAGELRLEVGGLARAVYRIPKSMLFVRLGGRQILYAGRYPSRRERSPASIGIMTL